MKRNDVLLKMQTPRKLKSNKQINKLYVFEVEMAFFLTIFNDNYYALLFRHFCYLNFIFDFFLFESMKTSST